MGTNDKTNWMRRLKGEKVALTLPITADYGYYRVKSADKSTWKSLFYWYDDDGELCCLYNGLMFDPDRALELFVAASENPITEELYDAVMRGEPWPDHNEVVTRLSNNPPAEDTLEGLQLTLDELTLEASRLMKSGAAKNQAEANQAADVARAIAKVQKRADELRTAEKARPLRECREIDDKWRGIISAADIYKRLEQIVCAPFLRKKRLEKEEAERKAREKAEAAAQEARRVQDEAKRKADEAARTADATALAEAEAAAAQAEAAKLKVAEAKQQADNIAAASVTAGTRGKSVSLRGKTTYRIDDFDAALQYCKGRPEIQDALQDAVNRLGRAGVAVPGVTVVKDDLAA